MPRSQKALDRIVYAIVRKPEGLLVLPAIVKTGELGCWVLKDGTKVPRSSLFRGFRQAQKARDRMERT